MIAIVTAENRVHHQDELLEMHRQRKVVFVDRLRWPLTVSDDLEIDDYDSADSIYLLSLDPAARTLLASLRLLPTTGRHLMSDRFGHLCDQGVPRGPAIWEASRFCVNPAIGAQAPSHQQLWRMIAGTLEAGLLFGIDRVTFVAGRALMPLVFAAGWQVTPLGTAVAGDKDRVTAMAAEVTVDGLREVRRRHTVPSPVTRYRLAPVQAA